MEFFLDTARECWITIHNGGWPELGWWSYLLLILLVATEGPVSTLIGAAAAATGILDIRYVFASALVGNILGDTLWYSVGYVSDLKRIHRVGSWLGLHHHHIDRLEHEMHRHATKLIALSKLAIGLIIPTLVAAGLARVPWRRWFPLVLCIETLWTLVMVNLGFHGAGLITQMERGLQLIGIGVLALIVVAVFWYGRRYFERNEAAMADELADTLPLSAAVSTIPLAIETASLIGSPLPRWHMRRNSGAEGLFRPKALSHRLLFATRLNGRPTAYKQLARRFASPRLSVRPLVSHSVAARSVMTRAMAEGKILLGHLATTQPASFASTHIPEVHFAGD